MSLATIHVGDAIEFLAKMPDACVDSVITDPPYGISFQSGWCVDGPRFDLIEGDDRPAVEWLPDGVRSLRDGGSLFVFCEWRFQDVFRAAIEGAGARVRSQCIWDREVHGMGDLKAAFAPCHDVGWFATKGAFAFHGPRPQSVLRFPRVAASLLCHPAEKPVGLLRHLVTRLCPVGGTVLDPFAGSGTTGVAAAIEGRTSILCEKVPEYADIASRRVKAAAQGTDWRRPGQMGLFAREAAGGGA